MEQIGSKALQGKTYCDKLFAIERFLMDCNVEEEYKNAKNFQMNSPLSSRQGAVHRTNA